MLHSVQHRCVNASIHNLRPHRILQDSGCKGSMLALQIPSRRLSQAPNRTRVGFLGLGNMGSRMATCLSRAGHDLVLYDVDESKAAVLAKAVGAQVAPSLPDLATSCSSIITMLPNTPQVEAVYLGNANQPSSTTKGGTRIPSRSAGGTGAKAETGATLGGKGLMDWVAQGTLLIDSSTIEPLAAKKMNAMAAEKGIEMVDAPVSGGVLAAAEGSLSFIVGGSDKGVERARPLLEAMGKNVMHCGEAGSGCAAKVCNNLCLAISMVGVSESMILGVKMGLDPKVLAGVLNASSGRCWSSDSYNPYPGVMPNTPSSRGFQGGFAASLMEKDLHLALQAAHSSSQPLPMGALAHQLYSLTCARGDGHKSRDFSSIFELIAGAETSAATQEKEEGS